MFRLLAWIIGGIFAVLALMFVAHVMLSWDTIRAWFGANKVEGTDEAILQKHLENGKYRVISGVFSAEGVVRTEKTWEGDKLDAELAQIFGQRDRVKVSI